MWYNVAAMSENEKEPANLKKEIFDWIKVIVLAIALTLILKNFVIVNAEVPTSSMVSLIDPGDRLIGFRLSYLVSEPERFDVVIFEYPVDPEQKFIKRVIGLPGETVDIRNAKIYINGSEEPLSEPYLPEEWVVQNDGYHYEVPEGAYLLLGDNRNLSLDARYWPSEALSHGLASSPAEAFQYSFVKKDALLGKALFKYYPRLQVL